MRVAAYDTEQRKQGDVYNPIDDVFERNVELALVGGVYTPDQQYPFPAPAYTRLPSGYRVMEVWIKAAQVAEFLKPATKKASKK